MSIERVEIDRVVVDGAVLPANAGEGIRAMLELELARLLSSSRRDRTFERDRITVEGGVMNQGDERAAATLVARAVIQAIQGG